MTCWFVTRHPGAARWAVDSGIDVSDEHVVPEIDFSRITVGDVIIGALPVHVVAEVNKRGARYLHLALDVPVSARGRELSAEQMRSYGSRLEEYRALPVEGARSSPGLEALSLESLRSADRAVSAAILKSSRIGWSE